MLKIKRINRSIGQHTYKVEGDIALHTNEELADLCDPNNWGYRVAWKSSSEAEIIIYID